MVVFGLRFRTAGGFSDPSFPVQNGKESRGERGWSLKEGFEVSVWIQCPGEKGRPFLFFSLLLFTLFFFLPLHSSL